MYMYMHMYNMHMYMLYVIVTSHKQQATSYRPAERPLGLAKGAHRVCRGAGRRRVPRVSRGDGDRGAASYKLQATSDK